MSNYNGPRVPLHLQNPGIRKAGPQENASYDALTDPIKFRPQYKIQDQARPNTHMMSVIRRKPDGMLDFEWAVNMVLDAVHKMSTPFALLPVDQALVTVVFPERFREMEPMQANLMTQFSASEKAKVKELVEARLLEEENWNAGTGGSSIPGRSKTTDGVP